MLIPADLIAAKLLYQLDAVPLTELRKELRSGDADQSSSLDLIARLFESGWLDAQRVKRARRLVAQFEHIRHEAVFLKLLEREHDLPKPEITDLIARLEIDSYRQRLSVVLVSLSKLTKAEATDLEGKTRRRLLGEDLKVLARYREGDFLGVGRPLIPSRAIDTSVFKVSQLFRSKETLSRVKKAMTRLKEAGGDPRPAHLDFLPDEDSTMESGDDLQRVTEAAEDLGRRISAVRFRPPAPASSTGLDQLRSIGPYDIMECIGKGGMGAVYLARDRRKGSMVALKTLLDELAEPEDTARFQREARITAMLDHQNLLRLIDEGKTEEGLSWMALSLYTGGALKDLLATKGRLPLDLAFDFFEQALAGLSEVHALKIVHRDIKPDNLFVIDSTRKLRIMDFGIARLLDDDRPEEQRMFRTRVGVISGSPAYIAPETVSGDTVDSRTDIYSLGVVLFEMLTGALPYDAHTPYDFLREHLVGMPMTLYQGCREVRWSSSLEALVAEMLAKEPADRPASCEEISARLEGGLKLEALDVASKGGDGSVNVSRSRFLNGFFKLLGR